MSSWAKGLRDAWALLALAFGQMILTFVFVSLVPYGYLVTRADSDKTIQSGLEALTKHSEEKPDKSLFDDQFLSAMGPTIQSLISAVPWFWLIVSACVLIYPFLGYWAGKLMDKPQIAGLLILGSVLTQQNICMIPHKLEYLNIAPVSLNLPQVLFLIAFEFFLLGLGMLFQHGSTLSQTKGEKSS